MGVALQQFEISSYVCACVCVCACVGLEVTILTVGLALFFFFSCQRTFNGTCLRMARITTSFSMKAATSQLVGVSVWGMEAIGFFTQQNPCGGLSVNLDGLPKAECISVMLSISESRLA